MSRGVGIVVGVGISSFFPLTSSIEEFFPQPSYYSCSKYARAN